MPQAPRLIDEGGQSIPVDRQLASGGEGIVFTLHHDSAHVAKVYHRPPTTQSADKLKIMVGLATPSLLAIAAWPKKLLYNSQTQQLAGFLMPRLADCQPIQHLYNPVQRLRWFSRATWHFQVRAAINLAAAFEELHSAGCIVGDVNQSNIQVSTQALVRLIDCDSFQIRVNGKAFPCEVGVAHYIPPELQGMSLRGLIRTENHDRFGLAVLIYQLLFVGRHPYAGVYRGKGDPSFEQLIAEYRFSQGQAAHSWDMAPPPHTPTFKDIPEELGALYRRAFERGSESGTRPRPAEWLAVLSRLEQSLAGCAADSGHKFWKGSQSCVWCRLADHGGPEYFFGIDGGVGNFTVDDARLQEVVQRLKACSLVDYPYERRRFTSSRHITPEPLPEGLDTHRNITTALGIAAGLNVLALPFALLHTAIGFVGGLGALVFGVWLILHLMQSSLRHEYRWRLSARNDAFRRVSELEGGRTQAVTEYQQHYHRLQQAALAIISQCRGLNRQYQTELQELAIRAEAIARVRHLRLYLIADADIPKFGAGRKQLLAQHGVLTAADIEHHLILRIKGFGDALANALLAWKDDALKGFRFDPSTAVAAADKRAIAAKCRNAQLHCLAELNRLLSGLDSLAPACRGKLDRLTPELQRAVMKLEQTEVNLSVFGIP